MNPLKSQRLVILLISVYLMGSLVSSHAEKLRAVSVTTDLADGLYLPSTNSLSTDEVRETLSNQPGVPPLIWPWDDSLNGDVRWTGGPHDLDSGGKFYVTIPAGTGSGLDFKKGEDNFEVLNMAPGKVIGLVKENCHELGELGCYVAVKHYDGGSVMIYGHLQQGSIGSNWPVELNKNVWLGYPLAKAGESGTGADNVHLHIDLRDGTKDTFPFGGPIGWDQGIVIADGYRIWGYRAIEYIDNSYDDPIINPQCTDGLDSDQDGSAIYNYDGSAVRGWSKNIWCFPYTDDRRKRVIAVTNSGFSCEIATETCENNDPNGNASQADELTQFAKIGEDAGLIPPTQSALAASAAAVPPGILLSTNTLNDNGNPLPSPTPPPNQQPGGLVSPIDNAVLGSHVVKFVWNLSSSSGVDVYIVRVAESKDRIDTGPWLVDRGIDAPATQLELVVPEGYSEYWYSVWACKGCKSGNPTTVRPEVRRFTVQPTGEANGFELCREENHQGQCDLFTYGTYNIAGDTCYKSARFSGDSQFRSHVVLFPETDLRGTPVHLEENSNRLDSVIYCNVRSLNLYQLGGGIGYCPDLPEGITFFSERDWKGTQSSSFVKSIPFLPNVDVSNYGSYRLCGYCVRFSKDPDYQGQSFESCGKDANASDDPFIARSVQVTARKPDRTIFLMPASNAIFEEGQTVTIQWQKVGWVEGDELMFSYYFEAISNTGERREPGWIAESSVTYPDLTSGTWTIRVKARNSHGEGPWSDPLTFTVFPGEAPTTKLTASGEPVSGGYYREPVTIQFDATDNASGVKYTEYSLDGGVHSVLYTQPFSLGEGYYTLLYRSVDHANHVEDSKRSVIAIDLPPTITGDIDGNCLVSLTDLSILLSQFGTQNGTADLNSDGLVNLPDLTMLLSNFGRTCAGADQLVQSLASEPGDCNRDSKVDAGDLAGEVLEIFDGDGTNSFSAPEGSFVGGFGCNANQDPVIDAADLSCTVLTIFDPTNGCQNNEIMVAALVANEPFATVQVSPTLSLPELVTAQPGDQVTLPISYTTNGHAISSMTFSIDYDQTLLSLDPSDTDEDGTPDTVTFNVPPAFNASATLNTSDTDGELDITILDQAPPLAALSSRIAVSLTFTVLTPTTTTDAVVAFSQDPAASFGSTTGQSVPGTTDNGLVQITGPCYILQTNVTPANAGTVSASIVANCEGNKYTAGTIVQLTANASTGYSFTTWSGNVSGSTNPVSVLMDGNKLVTATFISQSKFLFLPNMERASVPVLLTDKQGNSNTPSFSPDGTQIVFISDRDGNGEVYLMNADGGNERRLTNTPDIHEGISSFSPDGLAILFSAGGGTSPSEDIFYMLVDGTQRRNLTNTPDINEGRPRFSPDGSVIAFDSDRSGNWELYTAQIQDDQLVNIKQETDRLEYVDRLPSFSPDGERLLFRSEENGKGQESSKLFLLERASGTITSLPTPNAAWYPAWSQDEQWIAFVSEDNIYVMKSDGTNIRRLTTSANYADPVFSPDGLSLIVASNPGNQFDLYRLPIPMTFAE